MHNLSVIFFELFILITKAIAAATTHHNEPKAFVEVSAQSTR